MNLHYSQTTGLNMNAELTVLLPYEFTLLSNSIKTSNFITQFYYLMNLHYSQTIIQRHQFFKKFYYLMNLHYSQTMLVLLISGLMFYYLMNLHYSQTIVVVHTQCQSFTTLWIYTTLKPTSSLGGVAFTVLLPYEFTLLSNGELEKPHWHFVLLPYEFTLLSNSKRKMNSKMKVLLPYEFTLLSN